MSDSEFYFEYLPQEINKNIINYISDKDHLYYISDKDDLLKLYECHLFDNILNDVDFWIERFRLYMPKTNISLLRKSKQFKSVSIPDSFPPESRKEVQDMIYKSKLENYYLLKYLYDYHLPFPECKKEESSNVSCFPKEVLKLLPLSSDLLDEVYDQNYRLKFKFNHERSKFGRVFFRIYSITDQGEISHVNYVEIPYVDYVNIQLFMRMSF